MRVGGFIFRVVVCVKINPSFLFPVTAQSGNMARRCMLPQRLQVPDLVSGIKLLLPVLELYWRIDWFSN